MRSVVRVYPGPPRSLIDAKAGFDAGWSSPVARWAHNPKVAGSNPVPATNFFERLRGCSSAGRAPDLHSGGRRFDSCHLHQFLKNSSERRIGSLPLSLDLNFYTQLLAEIRVLIMNSRS